MFIANWALQDQPSHSKTLILWNGLWKTNKEFEKIILDETKWYKMDRNLREQQHRYAIDSLKNKVSMQLEAMELAIGEIKYQNQLQIERLQMQVEDYESEKLKSMISIKEQSEAEEFVSDFIIRS